MTKHTHQEPSEVKENIQHIKPYWQGEFQMEFDTEILEIDKQWLRLKENHFYAEGGGQLPDHGVLQLGNKQYHVINVQERDGDNWVLVNSLELPEIGSKVHALIDTDRRDNLSRNHSSQHLLSAVFWEKFENETTRAEIGVKETQLGLVRTPTLNEITEALLEVERIIIENVSITTEFVFEKNKLKEYNLRGGLDYNLPVYRMVNIGKYDRNLCGGTHVSSTLEIGGIYLHKVEGKKLRFYSGLFAKNENVRNSMVIQELARELGTKQEDLLLRGKEILKNYETSQKEIRRLKGDLLNLTYIKTKWKKAGIYNYKVIKSENVEKGVIIEKIGELLDNQIVFVITEKQLLVVISNSNVFSRKIMDQLRNKGIQGGGKGNILIGKVNMGFDKFESTAEKILLRL